MSKETFKFLSGVVAWLLVIAVATVLIMNFNTDWYIWLLALVVFLIRNIICSAIDHARPPIRRRRY